MMPFSHRQSDNSLRRSNTNMSEFRVRNDGSQQHRPEERRVLYVTRLRGVGRATTPRSLVYAFNYAAQPDGDADEGQQQVLDIYYPPGSNFAHIQMRTEEAAKRAKNRLDRSWLFNRYIFVDFGSKRFYDSFLSDRAVPSPRVIFGVKNTVSHQLAVPQIDGNNQRIDEEEQMRQNAFISKMPLGVTRHLMPGTNGPSGINKTFILNGSQNGSDEREVQRDREPESPVLCVTGIEHSSNGRVLTRYDLIMLFSCYGEVVDCDVYLDRRNSSGSISFAGKHHALVQMSSVEQATHAMNSLDFSWQMGRFIKVTYGREKSILMSNEQIKSRRRAKSGAQKGDNIMNSGTEMERGSNNELSSLLPVSNYGENQKEALQNRMSE